MLAARLDGHWLILDNRRSDLMDDHDASSFTPLFAINHRGVQLFAAPLMRSAYHLTAIVNAAPAASSGSDVGEWGLDESNDSASQLSMLPL